MLLAAQLSAPPVGDIPADVLVTPPRSFFARPQVVCRPQGAMHTSDGAPALLLRPRDRQAVRMRKLGDLPKANKEIAVARTVAGCAVPVGIRYQVEGDGTFARGPGR
jgi:hypothetical protein